MSPRAGALLVVDGWNVAHAWPQTKRAMARGDLQEARRLLVDALSGYAVGADLRVIVVFDGRFRPGPRAAPEVVDGVEVRYSGATPGETADAVIERLVNEAVRGADPPAVLDVATADRLVRDMVRAMGAQPLDPLALLGEVSTATADVALRIERLATAARGGMRLQEWLPRDVHDHLETLRRAAPPPPATAARPPRPPRERGRWQTLSRPDDPSDQP